MSGLWPRVVHLPSGGYVRLADSRCQGPGVGPEKRNLTCLSSRYGGAASARRGAILVRVEGATVGRASRWLIVVVVILGLAAVALVVTGRKPLSSGLSGLTKAGDRAASRASASDGAFEEIVVVCELPALGEPLPDAPEAHGPNCPTTQVSSLLGIGIATPHGIEIESVAEGGPAARGGILPGDGITACDGQPVDCPKTLLPHLGQGEERRPVELTVKRATRPDDDRDDADAPDTKAKPSDVDAQSSN